MNIDTVDWIDKKSQKSKCSLDEKKHFKHVCVRSNCIVIIIILIYNIHDILYVPIYICQKILDIILENPSGREIDRYDNNNNNIIGNYFIFPDYPFGIYKLQYLLYLFVLYNTTV